MTEMKFRDLTPERQTLVLAAADAMRTSYSPYSRFRVGAALLTENGEIIAASNVENASYGLSVCAETAAVTRANAQGYRKFLAIAVTGGSEAGPTGGLISPCGRCRQVLYEMAAAAGRDIDVILCDQNRERVLLTGVRELLPLGFSLPGGSEK